MSAYPCLVCGKTAVDATPGFDRLRGVGSDCRPWPGGTRLGICHDDGTVQKIIDDRWRREAAAIYGDYALYHQSADGAEVMVFDQATGAQVPRSQRILAYAFGRSRVPGRGRMLDVGCGTGATLRAFSARAPGWSLFGLEPNLKNQGEITAIPGVEEVLDGYLADIDGVFDLITVVHTLEHLEDPLGFLGDARARLTADGLLLVEVPYFPDNPFDLLVVDHSVHHTVTGLLRLLAAAGFTAVAATTGAVPREITVLARPATRPPTANGGRSAGEITAAVDACAVWLGDTLDRARAVAGRGRFGLFGTGIAANWLFGETGDAVEFFVDEDAGRIGSHYRGRPVLAPGQVPAEGNVFMVLPLAIAESITARLSAAPGHYHLPPPWSPVLDERDFSAQSAA